MAKIKKPLLFLVPLILLFVLYGCTGNIKASKYFVNAYAEVVTLVSKNDSADVYNVLNNRLDKMGNISKISDLIYNFNNSVYIYLLNISQGENLQHNEIKIEDKNGVVQLQTSYSFLDLKLSKDGSKLAYRSFNKDSYDGAEGIKLYDISQNKKIKFKTQVLISGNLYQWINNKEFIYYGVEENKKENSKIFKYDIDTNKEDVYLDNINGYCTFLYPIKENGILYIEENINEISLIYKNLQNSNTKLISSSISNIYNVTFDESSDCIYFTGLEKSENKTLLFKLSLKDMLLSRLNFDFPNEIDKNGGLALDSKHNLYFCGLVNTGESNNIYQYNNSDRAITLITNHEDKYYLGGNNK